MFIRLSYVIIKVVPISLLYQSHNHEMWVVSFSRAYETSLVVSSVTPLYVRLSRTVISHNVNTSIFNSRVNFLPSNSERSKRVYMVCFETPQSFPAACTRHVPLLGM